MLHFCFWNKVQEILMENSILLGEQGGSPINAEQEDKILAMITQIIVDYLLENR